MGSEERFVSYLDIPLQHSHPELLTAMRRGGSARRYLDLLSKAREQVDDIFLRSTFIVGFPGETSEHFEHLEAFVKEAKFDHLGAFGYSPEPGTPAAELEARLPPRIIRERHERLLEVQRPIALEGRRRLIGSTMTVLVEGAHPETEHLLVGRHHGQAPGIDGQILINDGFAPEGRLARVEISEAWADDLVGHIVGPVDDPAIIIGDAAAQLAVNAPAGAL
jgi:ribosomal protein S12 methylthiotransferase